MVWRLVLLAALAVVPIAVSDGGCGAGGAFAGTCTSGAINAGGVDVSASTGSPGSGGSGHGSGSGSGGGTSGPPIIWKCMTATCPPHPDDSGTPAITLSDIATFHPHPGTQFMQPDGWVVPGLDANFIAVTSQHIVNGTLLGQPASVRFTPVAFHWTYGDGGSATRATKGATWQVLGVPEFAPTSTSHVYAVEGTYTIRLTIDFAAEYRFAGGPFVPITGVIPLPANDLHVTVDGAKTVLVEHDCATNPSGPGC